MAAGSDPQGPPPTHRPAAVQGRPSYGIDAPAIVVALVALTVLATFIGIFVGSPAGIVVGACFWLGALVLGATATAMILSSTQGKPRLWRAVLDDLVLAGTEHALDVGCGRGLVLIELARRLPSGHATGVDIWRGRDQSGNTIAMTRLNAELAGVADRVTLDDHDMRRLPYPDASFDVVTASLAVHHLASTEDRVRAWHEMARVLRPGGQIVVVDIAKTDEGVTALEELGFSVTSSGRRWRTCPPSRIVRALSPPRA